MQPGSPYKVCPQCGQTSHVQDVYCSRCGHAFTGQFPQPQLAQAYYPVAKPQHLQEASSKKIAAAICGIVIGSLGVHKFVLGYTNAGLIMLLGSLLTCGFAAPVFAVIGLVEGIFYLTKSDEEFYAKYVAGRQEWF